MTVAISFFAGAGAQFFNDNGVPLAGGLIYSYAAGTTTPKSTFTTSAGSIANSNPIQLDSAGRTPQEIWLTSGDLYKFVLKDSTGATIGTYDDIPGVNDSAAIGTAILAQLASTTNNALGDALIGFKQSNAAGFLGNAVGRTVNAKLQESVSIKDFGAVGNGVANDTTAIQNAVNAAYAAGVDLYIPPGTYLITSTITLANNSLTMYGEGWSSVIKKNAGVDGIVITGNYCVLRDFTVDGNSQNNSGVGIKGDDNRVKGLQVFGNNVHGIYRDGQATTCRRNVVEQCYVHNNDGIGISCNTAPDSFTIGCVSTFNGLEGITDDLPSYRSGIVGNYLSDNCQIGGVGGIGIDQANNSAVTGNVVNNTQSSLPGICFQNNVGNTNYCTITGNSLTNNTGGGILMGGNTTSGFYCFDNVLAANTFQNNTTFDIRLPAGNTANTITGLQGNAVVLDINAAGLNTKSGYRCQFRVFNNTLRSNVTGDGTEYTVPFDGETSDIGNRVAAGVFTAPITGVYQLNSSVRLEGGAGQTSGIIKIVAAGSISQTAQSGNDTGTGGSAVLQMTVSDVFFLQRGDTVTVAVAGIGGAKDMDIAASAVTSYFSGALVG